ncbi:MAG: TIGR02611 family protein, partial [Dermacoccus nishinomiyaensis]
DWLERKGWWAQALAGLATFALVVAIFWAMFAVSGVPGWLPDFAENWLDDVPGLEG